MSFTSVSLCFQSCSECLSQLPKYCDFGCHGSYIISPSYVQSVYRRKNESPESDSEETSDVPPAAEKDPASPRLDAVPPTTSEMHIASSPSSPTLEPQKMPRSASDDSSLILDEGIRLRRSSADSDGMSAGCSPPPQLLDYRGRGSSDSETPPVAERALLQRKYHFSWQDLLTDLNRNTSHFVEYVRKLQQMSMSMLQLMCSPELRYYLERLKTPDRRSWYRNRRYL